MESKKIIAVTGATGAQGGGLAWAILNDKDTDFVVRALTRNPDSDKAKALSDAGAEVIKADIDDYESLRNALEGAYGAFFVTFFWNHFSPEKEKEQARNMARAARETGLKHVIWSTLEDTREFVPLDDDRMPTLMNNYKVPHFDGKGESNKYFNEFEVPTTFLLASFYWENLIYFGQGPQKSKDGTYSLAYPMGDKKIAGIASEDIGKCAYGILRRGKEYIGKTVGIAGDHLTGKEMADLLSRKLGKKVVYYDISPDDYRNLGFPGAEDLGNMYQFYRDFEKEVSKTRSVEESRKLNPSLKSFEEWLEAYKDRIPLD